MQLKLKSFLIGTTTLTLIATTGRAQISSMKDENPGLDLSASRLEFVSADDIPTLGQGFNADARRLLSQCLKLAREENGIEYMDAKPASKPSKKGKKRPPQDGMSFVAKNGYVESFKINEFSQYSNVEQTSDNNGFDLKLDFEAANPVATTSSIVDSATSAAGVANPVSNPTSPAVGSLLSSLTSKIGTDFELVFSHYYLTRTEKLMRTNLINKLEVAMSNDGVDETAESQRKKKAQVLAMLRICGDQFVKQVGYGFGVTRKISIKVNHDEASTGASPSSKMFDNFAPALKAVKAQVGLHHSDTSHSAVITIRQDYRGLGSKTALILADNENTSECSGGFFGMSKADASTAPSDIISCTLDPSDVTNHQDGRNYSERTQDCLEKLTRAERCLDEGRIRFMRKLESIFKKNSLSEAAMDQLAQPIFYRTANFEETLFNFVKVDTLSPEILEARAYVKSKMQLYYQYMLLLKEAIYTAKTRSPIFGSGGNRLRRLVKRFYAAKEVFSLAQGAYQNCNSYRVFDDIGATTSVSYLNPSNQSLRRQERQKAFLEEIGVNVTEDQAIVTMTGQQTCLLTLKRLKIHDEAFKMPKRLKLKRKLNVGEVNALN